MSKFLDKCKKLLKGKSIDYKMKFAEKLITERELSSKKGEELLDYIFDIKNSLKTDREVAQDEMNSLYNLLYDTEFWRNLDKEMDELNDEKTEELERVSQKELEYTADYKMLKDMERKHILWLSKR